MHRGRVRTPIRGVDGSCAGLGTSIPLPTPLHHHPTHHTLDVWLSCLDFTVSIKLNPLSPWFYSQYDADGRVMMIDVRVPLDELLSVTDNMGRWMASTGWEWPSLSRPLTAGLTGCRGW